MLILIWLSWFIFSHATIVFTPSDPVSINADSSNASLSWPFILPYTWSNPATGMRYRYGFSMVRVSLDCWSAY